MEICLETCPAACPPEKVNPSDPDTIPKFVDELPRPKIAKPCKKVDGCAYYEIEMRAAYHTFHSHFPRATVIWGYNGFYPGPTIEVQKDETILVKWINDLPEQHFLPIDHTLHGTIDSPEVRTVVHVHGANVAPDSDGHPNAWFTKDYRFTGSTFKRKVYKYTNHQPGTTLWYHDHALGITRLNVYAGLAGFYLIRDELEERLELPKGWYEVPILIQDKSFNEDSSLFYPDAPPFPVDVKPSVIPAFNGNTIVVNGKVWPYLKVEPRKYRFRLLNGSNTNAFELKFENGMEFYLIGTDGGLIERPVKLSSLLLEPAERADVIVDFSDFRGQKIVLQNLLDDSPHTGVIMQFRVELPLKGKDTSQIPTRLSHIHPLKEELATKVRNLTLSTTTDEHGRPMLLLDNRMWTDPATETPVYDSIEVWNIINLTPFPHPIHVHLVQFMLLDRQPFDVNKYQETGEIVYTGPPLPPADYERGWKDTIKAEAGMVTRIIMHFKEHVGDYVWHCHILEHEDHDMMRPLRVIKA